MTEMARGGIVWSSLDRQTHIMKAKTGYVVYGGRRAEHPVRTPNVNGSLVWRTYRTCDDAVAALGKSA